MMKRHAEKLSEVLGFGGEINETVMGVGRYLQDLSEMCNLTVSVGEQSITLHRSKAAKLISRPAANEDDAPFLTGGTGPASDLFKR